jgi:hypothetical protein
MNLRQSKTTLSVLTILLTWSAATAVCVAQLAFQRKDEIERMQRVEFSLSHIRTLPAGELLIGVGGGAAKLDANWVRQWPSGFFNETVLFFPVAIKSDGTFYGKGDTTNCVRHVMANGTADLSFDSPTVSPGDPELLQHIEVLSDGKILVGCAQPFNRTSVYVGINNGMFRLNSDGSTDSTFQYQPNGSIVGLAVLPNGKILANNVNTIFRLLENGQVDTSFTSPPVGSAYTGFAVQPDGKIVIVGNFTRLYGLNRPKLARLNEDGTLDFSFAPTVGVGTSSPKAVKIQPSDGGILINDGKLVRRWLTSGESDPGFVSPFANGVIRALDVDASERVYLNDDNSVFRYSGHFRILAPPASVPVVLEKSAGVDGAWTGVSTIPANTPVDYIVDSIYPGTGSTFFRTRPVP